MYFFVADEHFGHANIIKYCKRPFDSVEEMDETLIKNFNSVVGKNDRVIHGGDFTFKNPEKYIKQLNGNHSFVRGNHDRWLKKNYKDMWIKTVEGQVIVVAHYSYRVWPQSHYGSWMLYGHSHGKLPPLKNQHDIGVDNNQYYPVSFEQLKEIFKKGENANG